MVAGTRARRPSARTTVYRILWKSLGPKGDTEESFNVFATDVMSIINKGLAQGFHVLIRDAEEI